MEITKEQARSILNRWVLIHGLPVYDVTILEYDDNLKIESYTFRYLLSIAYDLKEVK